MNPLAGIDLGLLCGAVAGHTVHVFGCAQCFGAWLAEFEAGEFFAGRCGPNYSNQPARGDA